MDYDQEKFKPAFEQISIDDDHISSNWDERLYRVYLTYRRDQVEDTFSIKLEKNN